jgi:hypothetical protein
MYEMKLDVINNNKQHLTIELPEKTELQSIYVDNKNARPLKDNNGNILVPMRPKKHSLDGLVQISVTLSSRASGLGDEGHYKITFPKLNLPVNETAVNIFLPKGYEYSKIAGNLSRGDKQVKESDIETDFVIDPHTGEYLLKEEIGNLLISLVDQDGKKIDRAQVDIFIPNGQKKSDYSSNGEVLFNNLYQGKYSIVAKVNPDFLGYQNDIRVTAEKTREVTLVLTDKNLIEARKDIERSKKESYIGSGEKNKKYLVDGITATDSRTQTYKKTREEHITVIATSPIVEKPSESQSQEYDFEGSTNSMPSDIKLAGALSLKIEIPKSGIWYNFHGVLLIDEFPYLQFEYEKE